RTITVETTVDAGYTEGSIENTATVSSTTPDPNADNNFGTASVSVTPAADIAVEKVLASEEAVPGETVTYTVTATNNGPSDAAGVVVTDALPAGLSDVSASGTGPAGDLTCSVADPADPAASSGDVSCTVGALAVGQAATITVSGTLDPAFTGSLSNTATSSADTTDPNEDNNTSTATTDVKPKADLSLTKTADQTEVVAGELVTYTLTATNSGPSTATNVVLAEEIPRDLELESHDDRCSLAPSGESLICELETLSVNQSEEFTVTYRVQSLSTADVISNSAAISSQVNDPTADNNASTVDIAVTTQADVSITKSGAKSVVPGKSISWTLDVSNTGPSAARDLVISDVLPTGLKDIEVTGTAPTGSANCVVKPKENSSGQVTCSLAVLDVNTDATVTITALVKPGLTGELTNSATVQASTPDPDDSNNASTVATALIPTDTLPVTGVNAVSQMISAFALLTVGILLVLTRRRKLT
ncbi:MAG: DUF11 domain-containing protein, partial [Actinomycetaceae bacterium]|nr:DUF11 domain-containing protein [Actinomycetaceae bacterium]